MVASRGSASARPTSPAVGRVCARRLARRSSRFGEDAHCPPFLSLSALHPSVARRQRCHRWDRADVLIEDVVIEHDRETVMAVLQAAASPPARASPCGGAHSHDEVLLTAGVVFLPVSM